MVADRAQLEAMLEGAALVGPVEALELPAWGQTVLRLGLDPENVLAQWQAARALLPKSGRWPVATSAVPADRPAWRAGVKTHVPTGACQQSDESAVAAGEEALAEMRAVIAEQWPREPLAERLTYDLNATRGRCGLAPSEADVLAALPSDVSELALNRWLLGWEEDTPHGSEPVVDDTYLSWFTDAGWLTFLPTPCGSESLAYLDFWGEEGVPGATTSRLVAILELWSRRWGAELVAHWGTMLEFVVTRPPQSLEQALEVAEQHYVIAPDTLVLPGVPMRHHARALIGRDAWFLHERP